MKYAYINTTYDIYLEINMAVNPLQQYFRQPKVYISLPSQGVYNKLGSLAGDPTNIPVCGMTGMDEIIMKTPDALLSGESSVKVIESCCSSIKDAWELAIIDTVPVFAAIRIATFGNEMTVGNTCASCGAENEYDIDLNKIIDHFRACKYNNRIELDNLVINTKPITYKESTGFNLKNFQLQQRLAQANKIENPEEQQKHINQLFIELSNVRNEIFLASVDSIEANNVTVTERNFIDEFLKNCDKSVFDAIIAHVEKNRSAWDSPTFPVTCDSCGTAANLRIELDQSNFFV